ncbi:MAG TPA: NfeD family protein [Bacillales bacterium]|nr:NfeD family protein [Bacillales bacterium]
MMILLNLPVVGFFVITAASMLLFGEMLVKVRGIFALIGIGLMAVYFSYFLQPDTFFTLGLLYAVGLLIIVLDAKIMNHGFVAIIGLAMMIAALAIPAPSVLYAVLVGMGLLVGLGLSFFFLKVFPARTLWSRLALRDRLTSEMGYNSMNEGYRALVGESGVTLTSFRPSGTVSIGEKTYSAITEGKWLSEDIPVVVTSVDGTRIVVKEKPIETSNDSFSEK